MSQAPFGALTQRGVPAGFVRDQHNTVYCSNESTVITDHDFFNIVWALQYQVDFQFGPRWNIAARFVQLPKGSTTVPKGGIVLHFTDTLDVQGALGYHDEDGNEVPYGKIGAKTSQDAGVSISGVGSHEALELLVNLHVNLYAVNEAKAQVVWHEVGDPCQGADYDVGAPDGRPTGVLVADFALPNWDDPKTPANAKTSYRGTCVGPFNVAPRGYHGYLDLHNAFAADGSLNWQQAFGAQVADPTKPPVVNPE